MIFNKKSKRRLRIDERLHNFVSRVDGHVWAEITERLSALRARELGLPKFTTTANNFGFSFGSC